MKPDPRNLIGWFGLGVAVVLAAAGFVGLLVTWPVVAGLVTSHGLLALGVWWLTGRNLRAELEAAHRLHAAWDGGAVRDDLADVGPVTPPRGEFAVPEFMAESGYRRPCGNCGKPAVFVWETDGFPFAACNLCVSLWFEEGLPGHVVRLDRSSSEAECNIGGGTSTPNDANAILHAVEWLSLNCGWCGHWEKGQFTKDQVADWLRVHRNAMVAPNEGHTTTASTCPHPCAAPMVTPDNDEPVRCPDGGVCAYVPRGMASCDDECAVSLADDDEAREFLAEIRRSPGPVEDDTSDTLPHGRMD